MFECQVATVYKAGRFAKYISDFGSSSLADILPALARMGRRPYSAKAKREQLRSKRAVTSARDCSSSTSDGLPRNASNSLQQAHQQQQSLSRPQNILQHSSSSQSVLQQSSSLGTQRRTSQRRQKQDNVMRYRLTFAADSEEERAAARARAFISVSLQPHACVDPAEQSHPSLEKRTMSVFDVRPKDDAIYAGPKRPAWSYADNIEDLEARETREFSRWMLAVEKDTLDAAFFEQNLETWRQLWRVEERSDILLLVADIRYPALHFVPGLYHYITTDLRKQMVLALNKCDLVHEKLLAAWKSYFLSEFPNLSVALFSSFPDAKLHPSDANSELLSKREQRMARSRLSAWGADQLLAAVNKLQIPAHKQAYLQEWRALLEKSGTSDEARAPESKPKTSHSDGISGVSNVSSSDAGNDETSSVNDDESGDENKVQDDMVTIGVIGHPNSGKSSLINGIFGKKVVSTSRTPGHTKHLQTMFLSPHVRLCDCPGLVFPGKAARELQVLAGMFPISQLREPYAVVKFLADRVPLVSLLNLEAEVPKIEAENEDPFLQASGWTAWKICEAWAFKRGFRTAKAARLDVFRAANSILRLALDGRIVLATVPPGYSSKAVDFDLSESCHYSLTVLDMSTGCSKSCRRTSLGGRYCSSNSTSDAESSDSSECGESDEDDDEDDEDDENGGVAASGGMFAALGEFED